MKDKREIFEMARAAYFKKWPDAMIPSKFSDVGNTYVWLSNVSYLLAKYNYKTNQFVEITKGDLGRFEWLENPRKLTPFGQMKLTPLGHFKLTP